MSLERLSCKYYFCFFSFFLSYYLSIYLSIYLCLSHSLYFHLCVSLLLSLFYGFSLSSFSRSLSIYISPCLLTSLSSLHQSLTLYILLSLPSFPSPFFSEFIDMKFFALSVSMYIFASLLFSSSIYMAI